MISSLAIPATQFGRRMFTGRSARGLPLYGIVVHTTGSGIIGSGNEDTALNKAVEIYTNSGGPHYVISWSGKIVAVVADERIRGAHAGLANTPTAAVNAYLARSGWEQMLSARGAQLWHERWPGRRSPADIVPDGNMNNINTLYLGIEMIPITGGGAVFAPPMYPGARFTRAQHVALRDLINDIARRHNFPAGWNSKGSTRLVEHSDLNPVERDSPSLPLWDAGSAFKAIDMDFIRGGGSMSWLIAGGVAVVAGVLFAKYVL